MEDEVKHDGHRKRLLEMVYNVGLNGLNMVQATEFVLCYVFPRGDVNPLAHRLVDKFKTFSNMLDANLDDLASVKGMGEASAKKLKCMVQVFNLYTACKGIGLKESSTYGEIYAYIENLLRYKNCEEFYILGFNRMGVFIGDRCIARGSDQTVGVDAREISNFMTSCNASSAILVHNHPNSTCRASERDIESHKQINNLFNFAGYNLMDNLVVGLDGIYSIKERQLRKVFEESTLLKDITANSQKNDNN